MSRDELKKLIEPTQDGGQWPSIYTQGDAIMQVVADAIDNADDLDDLSNKLDYAITQLTRAKAVLPSGTGEPIED